MSSFLTAHHHKQGYCVPLQVKKQLQTIF